MNKMNKMNKMIVERGMVVLHYAVMVILFCTCWILFYRKPAITGRFMTNSPAVCTMYIVLLLFISRLYGAYKVGFMRVGEMVYSQTLANLVSLGITYVLASMLARRPLNMVYGVGVMLIQLVWSAVWTYWANHQYFRMNQPKKTIIIYQNADDLDKLEEFNYFTSRWNVQKTVQWKMNGQQDESDVDPVSSGAKQKEIYQLIEIMKDYEAVFVSGISATLRNGIVKNCVETGKECYFVPHTGDIIISGAEHMRTFAVPICRATRCSLRPEFVFVKRLFDVLISLIAIIILSPFMLLTAIAIKAYDHGPILYKQVRLTKDGKQFKILKFRSMKVNAEKDGVARLASENDDRITPVGKIIRAIRFDELPQLFNILSGDMSIVGPRPERPEIAAQYEKELPAFSLRLQVKAGLTGYAQVYGRYNTEPKDKLKMDLMYINRIGVLEDLKLIFATVRILFWKDSTQGIGEGMTTASSEEKKSV